MFEDLKDAALIEAIAAEERAASAAIARQARLIAALLARRAGDEKEFAVDEVRMELRLTMPAAEAKVGLAESLAARPAVWHALAEGRIDVPRARLICERLERCPEPARSEIEAEALAYAADHTTGSIRPFIERRLLKVDPEAANRRRREAITERKVTYSPLPDGMAELRAILPAEQARAIHDQLTLLARGAASHGDGRGSDALRADGLVALCLGEFRSLRVPTPRWLGAFDASQAVGSVGRRVEIQVLTPLATLLGGDGEPARLAGHGPIPHDVLHELAFGSDATWRRILTDPCGRVIDVSSDTYRPPRAMSRFVQVTNGTCTAPGCRQPAAWADLDHLVPFPAGDTSVANLQALCRHHHRMKHTGRWQVRREDDGSTSWITPAGKSYASRPAFVPAAPADPVLDERDAQPYARLRLVTSS